MKSSVGRALQVQTESKEEKASNLEIDELCKINQRDLMRTAEMVTT